MGCQDVGGPGCLGNNETKGGVYGRQFVLKVEDNGDDTARAFE